MKTLATLSAGGFAQKIRVIFVLMLCACAPDSHSDRLLTPSTQSVDLTPRLEADGPIETEASSQTPVLRELPTSSESIDQALAPFPVINDVFMFQDGIRNGTQFTDEQLSQKMAELIHHIDLLAIKENTNRAWYIVYSLESAQRGAILNAQLARNSSTKGLWLKWSERLFLTRDALKHFFSEVLLNGFEKAVNLNKFEDTQQYFTLLKPLLHRDHERRVISIIRGLAEDNPLYRKTLELLSSSGGPLARLYFYQKLITQPNLDFATALSKVGLPRISDLIGKSSQVSEPTPIAESRSNTTAERFVGDQLQDFRNQWTEFKRYFEELKQIPAKQQNARVRWSKLHEEVSYIINLISAEPAKKQQLRKSILQSYQSTEAPWEHSYRHDGIEFKQGDIILLQTGPVGGLWETLTQSGSLLSHLMMVHFDHDGVPMTVEMNYGQLLLAPLDLYSDRYTVIRPTGLNSNDRKAIYHAISELIKKDLQYDFKFDLKSADKLYCSELVAAVFEKAGISRTFQTFNPLSSQATSVFSAAGIRTKEFYTQGSYIAGLGFSSHAERLNSDPRDYIRGLLVLEGFSRYISEANSVQLSRHPEAHQLYALATLAQTVTPGVRRALGPPRFLFTALVLDKLINTIEEAARRAQIREPSTPEAEDSSRIVELKRVINLSLEKAIPLHLSEIFPRNPHILAPNTR